MSQFNLENRKILVTGGGGVGVGAGICSVLSEMGAHLFLNEITAEKAESAARNYKNSIPIAADISKRTEVEAMFQSIEQQYGPLDGIVNNAGIGLSKEAHKADEEDFQHLIDVDLKGVWRMSKLFANQLIRFKKTGAIVNISSVNAQATIARYAIYSSAKSGVEGLTRGMATELGKHGIRVNAVGPGYVHAEQNYELIKSWTDDPQQWIDDFPKDQQVLDEFIKPEYCGNVVAFLLSDLSAAITGQTIYVDSGTLSLLFNRFSTEQKNL